MNSRLILSEQVWAERRVSARIGRLLQSPLLTDEHRQGLLGMLGDERNHVRWLTDACVKYGGALPMPLDQQDAILVRRQVREMPPEHFAALIYIQERYGRRFLNAESRLFRSAGDLETSDLLAQVSGEEWKHGVLSHSVVTALVKDPTVGPGLRDFWRNALRTHYRRDYYATKEFLNE